MYSLAFRKLVTIFACEMFNINYSIMLKLNLKLSNAKSNTPEVHGKYGSIRNGDNVAYGDFSIYANKSGIYGIKCKITNKIYIGSSKDLQKRFSKHFSELYLNRHANKCMQEDFNKYGYDNFELIVYEYTNENLLSKETNKQKELGVDNIYNEKISGFYITKELRQKYANASKESHKTESYRNKMRQIKSNKVAQYDLEMNLIKIWDSALQIHKELGHTKSVILCCCNGSKKRAYGYNWRYVDDNGNIVTDGYEKGRKHKNKI